MSEAQSGDAWYTSSGPDSDVVISTRIRLARDLASFPFPARMKGDDSDRVRSLIFDAFSHCSNPDCYQAIITSKLDAVGKKILCERGVMDMLMPTSTGAGVIIRTDGFISATVNDIDHLRLSSFKSGLAGIEAFELCRNVDDELQNSVQFAANYEKGYLTSSISDCGSGMKASCRVRLSAITFSGYIKRIFTEFDKKGIVVRDCFGASADRSSALGSFYQISTKNAGNGNEIEQLASLIGAVKYLVETERKLSQEVFASQPTELKDKIYSAYARAKFSFLISAREAVELISLIGWGKMLGLLNGISDDELRSLIYRIQSGHLQFLMNNREFNFSDDVARNPSLKENHLRALVLQDSFNNICFS